MEIREGSVKINRKEMKEMKRMDHQQLEEKLTEAYARGHYLAARKWQRAVKERAVSGAPEDENPGEPKSVRIE